MYQKKRPLGKEEFSFKSEKDIIRFYDLPIEEKIKICKEGISRNQVEDIRRVTDTSLSMLYCITGIHSQGITGKKGRELLSSRNSEVIVQMVSIYGFGYRLFGKVKEFNMLMYHGCINGKFGNLKQLSSSIIGRNYIPIELARIRGEYKDGIWNLLYKLDPIPLELYRSYKDE